MLCNEEKRACCKRHRNGARLVVGNVVKVGAVGRCVVLLAVAWCCRPLCGAVGRRVVLLVVDKELLYSLGSPRYSPKNDDYVR